uniref:Uncharacterized protein n=1 Tax=Rhizophora mucronata TaxID=61149 RepID=A0A2P2KVI4_RHIMU
MDRWLLDNSPSLPAYSEKILRSSFKLVASVHCVVNGDSNVINTNYLQQHMRTVHTLLSLEKHQFYPMRELD